MQISKKGLDTYYKILNCRIVEMPDRLIGDRVYTFIVDEEGKLKDNQLSAAIVKDGDIEDEFVGNIIITKVDYSTGELVELDQSDIDYILNDKNYIEYLTTDGVRKYLTVTY
ncbi:MAG: hypothetical protein J5525_12450 [Lachnospiraceae bacterium]|nr:hypothetical protein [Lachnospiraceae bacterium]